MPLLAGVGILASWAEAAVIAALGLRVKRGVTIRATAATVSMRWAAALMVAGGIVLLAAAAADDRPSPPAARLSDPEPNAGPSFALAPAAALGHGPSEASRPPGESGRRVNFRGRVFGPDETPLRGARIYLNPDAYSSPELAATSGPDGSYRFDRAEEVFWRNLRGGFSSPEVQASLFVEAKGHGPDWFLLPAGERDGKTAMRPGFVRDFRLSADRPIEGRVVDAKGRPVAGARVDVLQISLPADRRWEPVLDALRGQALDALSSSRRPWSTANNRSARSGPPAATTDASGRFRVQGIGRDRRVDIEVRGPGTMPMRFSVLTRDDVDEPARLCREKFPPQRHTQGAAPLAKGVQEQPGMLIFGPTPTVVVDPARTVSGVVRAAESGKPIPGIEVHVDTSSGIGAGRSAPTDARGHYRVLRDDAEPTTKVVTYAYRQGEYLFAERTLTGVGGLGDTVADFELMRGIVVSGRVVEAGTGRPIVSAARDECGVLGAPVAGYVHYRPLANNSTIRGTPTGAYFEGNSYGRPRETMAEVGGDGSFLITIPPGPGVLIVEAKPGLGLWSGWFGMAWPEEDHGRPVHRLFPYPKLRERIPGDGAPSGPEPASLAGFSGSISLTTSHAYRVVNPLADARSMTVEIVLTRGLSRRVRFVDPRGESVRGVIVHGLLAPPLPAADVAGSEAEVTALESDGIRELLASFRRRAAFSAKATLRGDSTAPETIRMEPSGELLGRLVNLEGRPIADHRIEMAYDEPAEASSRPGQTLADNLARRSRPPLETDADGRFQAPSASSPASGHRCHSTRSSTPGCRGASPSIGRRPSATSASVPARRATSARSRRRRIAPDSIGSDDLRQPAREPLERGAAIERVEVTAGPLAGHRKLPAKTAAGRHWHAPMSPGFHRRCGLSIAAHDVLIAICSAARRKPYCWIGNAEIAEQTGLHPDEVK